MVKRKGFYQKCNLWNANITYDSLVQNSFILLYFHSDVSGLKYSLEQLDLSNTSLTILPSFNLPSLVHLNMSSNKLTFLPSTALANMSSLRCLDLSNNYLPSPPHMVWHIMPRLRYLSLARNPIKSLFNESFLSLDRLERLDISYMEIDSVKVR